MKQEYNIKDRVWIHIGEHSLAEGRVVEIITLDHLKENHTPGAELYIIEIKTGIEDIYEVRDFLTISPDAAGPIMCYRNRDMMKHADRYLRRVGIKLPHVSGGNNPVDFPDLELYPDEGDAEDPSPEQIHAAIERAEKARDPIFNPHTKPAAKRPAKKRTFVKRKKSDANSSNNS